MRIRKKLIVLHTAFSLGLAVVLLLAIRPAIGTVVTRAEYDESVLALRLIGELTPSELASLELPSVELAFGSAEVVGLDASVASAALAAGGTPVPANGSTQNTSAVRLLEPAEGETPALFLRATARIPEARRAVVHLYAFVVAAVLTVYALIVVALELLVLPRHVYGPIRRMLDADFAVQQGDSRREIIPERHIPADELGEIMRSRNDSVLALRRHERDLAEALQRVERIAADLKQKNHMLETARRNLADADRLASLGMMSAGIAHELNTPLTVVKGLVEKLESSPGHSLEPAEAQLLLRVVRRLEGLGESLLDFARVRPSALRPARLATLADEAITLVRLDRQTHASRIVNEVDPELEIACDAERIVQVLVNLIRNGADAVRSGASPAGGRVVVGARRLERDESSWVAVTVTDDGPGIDPDLIERIFEPFVSSRLDARGTGLGLAVVQGIVHEHGGVIVATNRPERAGAVFEFVLPETGPADRLAPGLEPDNGGADARQA
ncbi:MAG: sensor histidine kinase [Phycisphaerales bacterium]